MFPRPSRQTGFSLIELMIVVVLLAIVAAFAMPAFQSLIASSRLTADTNELIAGLNLARSEAVRMQRRVILCRTTSSNGVAVLTATSGCVTTADATPWQAWAVFIDSDADGVFDGNETIIRTQVVGTSLNFVSDATLGAAGNRIVFRPDGLARAHGATGLQSASVNVCDQSGALATQNMRVVSLVTGSRMSVTRQTNQSSTGCSAVAASTEEDEASETTQDGSGSGGGGS
ncbi:GspH/FimT family pseudopilin [Methyloversatilis thermotolerans]|uniref:GspH/FimT family pseudopilin n=1 Tax=Methyloversatilis thermotolerans TaxID=1346290 RepID=UPI000362470E|nr:GspH/FimT family pseudopilin [Methyloversatilis thermotolerans]